MARLATKLRTAAILLLLGCILAGCDKNPNHRNVKNIEVDFTIQPFHSDFIQLGNDPTEARLSAMQATYGDFFDIYVTGILANARRQILLLPPETPPAIVAQRFAEDKWMAELSHLADSTFLANKKTLESSIRKALQYYKFYFPEKQIPQLRTFVGGLDNSMAICDDCIGIGIDKYLGARCPLYNSVNMEAYVRRNLNPEKIPADLMRALAESDFPDALEEDYLLAKMIQCGRYQYFVKSMLPDEPDTILWGFTQKQLSFCEQSEAEFWRFFISTDGILFSTDRMTQKRFLDDGPFTTFFTKESPARVGQWIGFKIVESFMQNNPDVSLTDLFTIRSSKEIISRAKYNPK